jgi:signal-transduction protein with cAMP-binding, CBS, and nucleotidyltransferase domain
LILFPKGELRMEDTINTGVKIGDIMDRNMLFASPNDNIMACAEKMIKNRMGLIIVKGKDKIGLLSKKDIIWALTKDADLKKIKAGDIMSKKIISINPSKDIYDGLLLMKKNNKRWLPVIEKGKLIGMLTIKDILRIEPSLFDIAVQNSCMRRERMKRLDVMEELDRNGLLMRGEID